MYCSVWVCDYHVSVFVEHFVALTIMTMYMLLALLKG